MDWITFAFACVLIMGALSDLRDRTIPNVLTLPALGAGIVLAALPGGISLSAALLGAGLAFVVSILLFALGAFGGGDAKLLMVVGAFMGPIDFLNALLFTALIGGVMAVYTTARLGLLRPTLKSMGSLVVSLVTRGRRGRRITVRSSGVVTIPYGVAIAAGSLIAWFG